MTLASNRRGISSEALKIAAAVLIGFGLFSIFLGFAAGPQEADTHLTDSGERLLEYTENASVMITQYE
jgi:hypothetical protein